MHVGVLKGKKKMRKCLVPALVCATLAAAAWGRPRRRRPWAQAFDHLQPNRTVPLADRWPRPPPTLTPAQLEIANQKRKWVAGADAAYAKDAREHDGERERAAQAKAASTQRTVISVMDHGAKGDGVADDKAAFEAAVAAARGVKRAVVLARVLCVRRVRAGDPFPLLVNDLELRRRRRRRWRTRPAVRQGHRAVRLQAVERLRPRAPPARAPPGR